MGKVERIIKITFFAKIPETPMRNLAKIIFMICMEMW